MKKDPEQIRQELVDQIIGMLMWVFGWLPRSQVLKIAELREKWLPQKEDVSEDGEQRTTDVSKQKLTRPVDN